MYVLSYGQGFEVFDEETFSEIVRGVRTRLEGLKPCTNYELSVSAVLGQMYSKRATDLVSTIPEFDAVDQLDPIVNTSVNSIWMMSQRNGCPMK